MIKEILVAGGTGGVGRHVVNRLLNQGRSVRLLARDVGKAGSLFEDSAIVFSGDIRKPETLVTPLKGVHMVICATGSKTPIGPNSPQHVDYEGVANLVRAAKDAGVERFVLVSSCAVTQPNHPLNAFGKVLTWKLRGEDALRASGLAYTIIRPGGLSDEPGGTHLLKAGQGDKISGMISREDVARACIEALESPTTRNVTFEIIQLSGMGVVNWSELFADLKPDSSS